MAKYLTLSKKVNHLISVGTLRAITQNHSEVWQFETTESIQSYIDRGLTLYSFVPNGDSSNGTIHQWCKNLSFFVTNAYILNTEG